LKTLPIRDRLLRPRDLVARRVCHDTLSHPDGQAEEDIEMCVLEK